MSDKKQQKDFTANLNADIPSRTCTAYITTDCVDEEGEVVLPKGIQTSRFSKTGTVFWNHDYSDPVAINTSLEVTDRGVMASTYFPEKPDGHSGEWRPDAVLALVASGLCKGISIGFSYLETRHPTGKDIKTFRSSGNELKRVVSKSRLLEYSFAPLPMNEDALIVAVQKGFITKGGRFNLDAIRQSRLLIEGFPERKSLKLQPSNRTRLKKIDPAKMTRLEIQRLQGRVY